MRYLDEARTLATYVAESGDHAFVQMGIMSLTPESPGFASGATEKIIAEAVFVADADAPLAMSVLAQAMALPADDGALDSLRRLFTVSGVDFRVPARPFAAEGKGCGSVRRRSPRGRLSTSASPNGLNGVVHVTGRKDRSGSAGDA